MQLFIASGHRHDMFLWMSGQRHAMFFVDRHDMRRVWFFGFVWNRSEHAGISAA